MAHSGSGDFLVNGEKLATQKAKLEPGPLILRAETGQIWFKNIWAKDHK